MNNYFRLKYRLILFFLTCFAVSFSQAAIVTGAERMDQYLPLIKNKNIALVVNQTSIIKNTHLADTLKSLGIKIIAVFAPEHGFRGDHSAGAHVNSSVDERTGLKIISLYGDHKKPTAADLKGIDYIIYDIQDVGARFYTYISTLHYVMEACAENKKKLIVLDRPNPNGHYIDGPVLDMKYKSFVGMHPVPIVHGMTTGEYAKMINGEKWLKDSAQCKLTIISMKGYTHTASYSLPVKPSPNLPTSQSVCLYPTLCLFEGTNVSVGRGTEYPFEVIGKPGFTGGKFVFKPVSIPGVAENPPYKNQECRGIKLTEFCNIYLMGQKELYLFWLIGFYEKDQDKEHFFNDFFDKLAGTDQLRKQIQSGKQADEIAKSWEPGLKAFKKVRSKYLLYPDFPGGS